MVEVDANLALIGPDGAAHPARRVRGTPTAHRVLLHVARRPPSGRAMRRAARGCTTQVAELSYLHSRDITYAVFCQGPYDESIRYHDFMGWDMPWYSALVSLDELLVGRQIGMMHLVCYVRDGDRVFETYWTTRRGVEVMDYSYALDGPHGVRTPGVVGGLAARLATTMLHHADQRRLARLATGVSVAGRTPHRPVVATRSWTL